MTPLSLAILGTRGVPPNYGGFETFAAELSRRLVARGHRVAVYCREEGAAAWKGVDRIVLPAIRHKYFETVSHAALSALDAVRRDFDVILVCNAANAFVIPLLRAARIPVAINVDGIERRRRKWNAAGRAVYALGESFSVSFANQIIADANVIADYYRTQYSADPATIAYGADFPDEADTDVLARLGIRARDYILYVSRFEPENNPLAVVRAYEKLEDAPPLVMVGRALYARDLGRELRQHASSRILLPGAIYGADYRTLQRNALLYVHATEVGGTHPAMIEAMASGGAVVALATPENREVGGAAAGYFHFQPEETLSRTLHEWLGDRERLEGLRVLARQRAAERFRWEPIVDAYEAMFRTLSKRP